MQYKVRLGSTKRYRLFGGWGGGGVKAIPRTALLLSKSRQQAKLSFSERIFDSGNAVHREAFTHTHPQKMDKKSCKKAIYSKYWVFCMGTTKTK